MYSFCKLERDVTDTGHDTTRQIIFHIYVISKIRHQFEMRQIRACGKFFLDIMVFKRQ